MPGIVALDEGEQCHCVEDDIFDDDDTDSDVDVPDTEDVDCDSDSDDAEGDPWVRSIEACSCKGGEPLKHVHIKIADEKVGRRRLFF